MHKTFLFIGHYNVEQYYILLDSVHLSEIYLIYRKFWNMALLLSSGNSNANSGPSGSTRWINIYHKVSDWFSKSVGQGMIYCVLCWTLYTFWGDLVKFWHCFHKVLSSGQTLPFIMKYKIILESDLCMSCPLVVLTLQWFHNFKMCWHRASILQN